MNHALIATRLRLLMMGASKGVVKLFDQEWQSLGSRVGSIAATVSPRYQREGKVTFRQAFHRMQHWAGDRTAQGAVDDSIRYTNEPFHDTWALDRMDLLMTDEKALLSRAGELAEEVAKTFAIGYFDIALDHILENPTTRDNQFLFDENHQVLDGSTRSNVLLMERATANEVTIGEAEAEIARMRQMLQQNRALRIRAFRASTVRMTLIIRHVHTLNVFEMLRTKKTINNTDNELAGTFDIEFVAPTAGEDLTVKFIDATPGGLRPVTLMQTQKPLPLYVIDPNAVRKNRNIEYGSDAIYGRGEGFWESCGEMREQGEG